jgi:hypothetical protein
MFQSNILSKRGIDTSLRSDSVTSCGKELRDTGSLKPGLRQTKGRAKTGTTGANNEGIVFVVLALVRSPVDNSQGQATYNHRVLLRDMWRGLLCTEWLACDDPRWREKKDQQVSRVACLRDESSSCKGRMYTYQQVSSMKTAVFGPSGPW